MNNVKAIRQRLELTQEALAKGIGCTQGNVGHYERGQSLPPEMARRLIAFAAELGHCVSFDDIYSQRELPTPQPTTEPAAAAMVPLLQSGLEKAEQALADEPTDRVARLVQRNRAQALAEIAATPQPTTEPAAAGV